MKLRRRQSRRRTHESWKGHDGYKRAEAVEDRLRQELGKEPTKRDFRNARRYNVWMALYRHRRKFPDQKKIRLQYQSFREILLRDNKLMEKVLRDVIATLGPTKVEDMIEDVKTTRFLTH